MKKFLTIPAPLAVVTACALAVLLPACGSLPVSTIESKIHDAQFKMPRKPASCTRQSSYPSVVRQCRQKICDGLKEQHCKKGMDDVASAQWLSCVKEELLVTGANKDDCRLFLYDLEAAMKAAQ